MTLCTFLIIDYLTFYHDNEGAPTDIVKAKEGQHISPETLKQWLDEGRDITLLDTRNTYEWRIGMLANSVTLDIETFREFPEAMQSIEPNKLEQMKNKPLVMYCTGGVRCEKAGPFLQERLGFNNVYQLEGGILKYFETVGKQLTIIL